MMFTNVENSMCALCRIHNKKMEKHVEGENQIHQAQNWLQGKTRIRWAKEDIGEIGETYWIDRVDFVVDFHLDPGGDPDIS